MATIVEIHVPLEPVPQLPPGAEQFPWIDEIEEYLADQDDAEVYDDGEEYGDVYVFFIGEADADTLLDVASRVAALPNVPEGAVAFVTEDDAEEFGLGRRVALPIG